MQPWQSAVDGTLESDDNATPESACNAMPESVRNTLLQSGGDDPKHEYFVK